MPYATQNPRSRSFVLPLVCAVLQLAIAPQIGLGNGRINFMLILAACIALRSGGRTGVIWGFLAGLFFDLSTTGPIGLMAAELTLCSWVLGRECRNRLSEDRSANLIAFGVADLLVSLGYSLAMLATGNASGFLATVFLRALPMAVLTFVFFLPFLHVLGRPQAGGGRLGGGGMSFGGAKGRHLTIRGL